jgi:alcohol dehydrogenase (cytochrome c)
MTPLLLALLAQSPVPFERISSAATEPGNWLTYSGNLQGHRHSPLTQINAANVANLKVKWVHQFSTPSNQTTPLVVGNVMYISGPNTVSALDTRTGRPFWNWSRPIPADYQSIGFGRTNRGLAILGDTLFVGTLDCFLVAIDAKSGIERWTTKAGDYKLGYSFTVAPLAIRDKIIIGTSGGEAGIRGWVDAYDAKTGKQAWRFHTIPGPGEPGHDTWQNDAWKTGGGSTWVTGAYDPALNLVYWGVGNPAPDWNGDVRPGDNLYSCSFIALDGDSGKLKWHFQFTPHDTHDWDAAHVPILFDAEVRGRKRKLIANANRNGFYYLLDRESGEFLTGKSYVKQTWAKGLDDNGRPIVIEGTDPSTEGTLVWPSLNGATIWFSPSYSPATRLYYVAAREKASIYFKRDVDFKPGTFFAGGGEQALDPNDEWGAIRALDAITGQQKWEFKLVSPPWGGVMSTAGNLVFAGSNEGSFFALDATTGKPLWDFQTGGFINANPISFNIDGKQHIAIAANRVLYVFGL